MSASIAIFFRYTTICFSLSLVAGLAAERRPWNVVRFLQQSSKFVSLPFVGRNSKETVVRPGDVLWRLSDDQNSFTMAPLDDVVMGGASASTFDSATGTWSGIVTDANSGGFIGLRSSPSQSWNMRTCKGLEWKVKLNSPTKQTRRFKFVLRDSTEFNGITWSTSYDLRPGMNTVRIDFNKQVPALFARTVAGKTFQKDAIAGVQIAYSKFEYDGALNSKFALGDISLRLLELRAF